MQLSAGLFSRVERVERAAFCAIFAFFAAETASNADVVVDRDSEIVVATNAAYATRLAAEELNFFLKGVLGEALPVVAQRTEGKTAIVLGVASGDRALPSGVRGAPALPSVGADHTPLATLLRNARCAREIRAARDGFMIEVCSNAVYIAGNDDDVSNVDATAALPDEAIWQPCFRRGTLFGVYAFLERFAGVRMYFPGALGTCIPKMERIVVTEGRVEESPAFSVRRYGYADGPVAKELLDDPVGRARRARRPVGRDAPIAPQMNETDFKRLNWYRLRMETYHLKCCHGAKTHCLSPETWDAIYTNACAVIADGGGTPSLPDTVRGTPSLPDTVRGTPSLPDTVRGTPSLPDTVRGTPSLPDTVRGRVAVPSATAGYAQPVFDAMPKDGLTWARHCNCEWCMKNVPFSKFDIGFATDLVWRRTAELAGRIKAKFPHARVSQMSYIPYARIPTNEIPDNVDVFVARRGPWAEGTAIGAREKDEVAAWHAKLGRKVSLWNYPDKVDCWNLEMKDIPQLAPRAWSAYYRAVAPHVTGAFAESESDRWIYNYLNYYVFSRVCWNPDADVEAILAEHHRLMFGAAAEEMAEFFDTLEKCWMQVVAKPYDTPLGPGVCEAPTDEELRTKIYSPEVLSRLASLVSLASSKVAEGSIEARRIALFGREYLEQLCRRFGGAFGDRAIPCEPVGTAPRAVRIGLLADIHIGDGNDNSDLKRALRIFDAKKADAVIAAGDLTDFGLLSELKEVAAAWNEVFPSSRRSDGEPVVRLFHYGDHDTALNFKVRQLEVVEKGRWADYIPHVGPDVAWERAFGEKFEPVVRRTVKGVEFTLVHFLPEDVRVKSSQLIPPQGSAWLHVFSQHRTYRGLFARPGCGDEISWDDGASLAFVTNVQNMIAVSGHGHISAANDTSFVAGGGRGATALPDGFAAIAIPSLYYQIETWLPKPKGDHGSHQALFMTATTDGITIERLDVRTGGKIAPDIEWGVHKQGTRKDNPPKQTLRPL